VRATTDTNQKTSDKHRRAHTHTFFGSTEGWSQGIVLSRQVLYHLWHYVSHFCVGYFWDRVSLYTGCQPGPGPSYLSFLSLLGWQALATAPSHWLSWGPMNFILIDWFGLKPWSSQSPPPEYLGLTDLSHFLELKYMYNIFYTFLWVHKIYFMYTYMYILCICAFKIYIMWFSLYIFNLFIQKLAKISHGVRSQNSGYHWRRGHLDAVFWCGSQLHGHVYFVVS
jgi:hypothetical protein